MSEPKHTPGPWRVEPIEKHGVFEVVGKRIDGNNNGYGEGTVVAIEAADDGGIGSLFPEVKLEDSANAHLIAAAPDLLEALEAMLEMSENGGFGKAYAEDITRAALAKAKGE